MVFDAAAERHLALGHPELVDHFDAILGVVFNPDHRTDDPRAGRERFYRRHIDGRRWLRVVVDFNRAPGRVITAMIDENAPRGWPR